MDFDAEVTGVGRQLEGLDRLFQWEFVRHQLVQVQDLTAETLNSCRPCITISVDELEVDLLSRMSAPDNHHGARKLRLAGKMKD